MMMMCVCVCVCVCVFAHLERFYLTQHETVRDGPLENLWGGGGRTTKKIFAQAKIKQLVQNSYK